MTEHVSSERRPPKLVLTLALILAALQLGPDALPAGTACQSAGTPAAPAPRGRPARPGPGG